MKIILSHEDVLDAIADSCWIRNLAESLGWDNFCVKPVSGDPMDGYEIVPIESEKSEDGPRRILDGTPQFVLKDCSTQCSSIG